MVPYNVKASDIGCDIIEFSFEHMCIRIPKNTILDWSFWKICTKKIFLLVKVVVLHMLWNIKKWSEKKGVEKYLYRNWSIDSDVSPLSIKNQKPYHTTYMVG